MSSKKSLEKRVTELEDEVRRLKHEIDSLYSTIRCGSYYCPPTRRDIYLEFARDGSRGGCPG